MTGQAAPPAVTARAPRIMRFLAVALATVGGFIAFVGGAILLQVEGWAPAGIAVWALAAIAGPNAVIVAWWARIRLDRDGVLHKRLHPVLGSQQVHLTSLQRAVLELRPVYGDGLRHFPVGHEGYLQLVDARGGRMRIWLPQWAPLDELVRGIRAAAAPAAADPDIARALADLQDQVPRS